MIEMRDRFLGALFGLAYGDAIGFPSMFYRFHAMQARRRSFVWRTNLAHDDANIVRLTMPFTHRDPPDTLEPCPTDDTEFALFTTRALLADLNEPTLATFLNAWQTDIVSAFDRVAGTVSHHAAIENLKRGLLPPATGSDNPLHYEDAAVPRAVPIGLYYVGRPDDAARVAALDASITQAEDGIYAARAMAAAIAVLGAGEPLSSAVHRARSEYPEGSWIAYMNEVVNVCTAESESVEDLVLRLSTRVINTVYTCGGVAPETFPAALAISEACDGDLQRATLIANAIPKASDSLPAMVGAICGTVQGIASISDLWRQRLATCRGVCLPVMKDAKMEDYALRLYARVSGEG